MKFDTAQYWKHRNCREVFFSVNTVSFDDDGKSAIIHGTWCTQGVEGWWFTVTDRLLISDQYAQWQPYQPKGRIKF